MKKGGESDDEAHRQVDLAADQQEDLAHAMMMMGAACRKTA